MLNKLRRVWRSLGIWGVRRTIFKIAGRIRSPLFAYIAPFTSSKRHIGVLGCGQFSFSTIGFAITKEFGNAFVSCYDTSAAAQESFSRFYRVPSNASSAADVINDARVKVVYIASNHASHTDYAIKVIEAKKIPYVEKPVSVTWDQLRRLSKTVRSTGGDIYAGYNRPFSPAIKTLRTHFPSGPDPTTISCFVVGHVIEASHWYRKPEEGTRICGNAGHWLDLAVHILSWISLPDSWTISIAYSDENARDDNIAITMASTRGDLVSILLSSRAEPFEGINETINIHSADLIAKIDDFRVMDVWKGEVYKRYRYWPKNAGHDAALLQPYSTPKRDWREVELSTCLMLFITDMVKAGVTSRQFSFSAEMHRLSCPPRANWKEAGSS